MNEQFYRFVCEVCGRATMTPIFADAQVMLFRDSRGENRYMPLCPEHKAQWERMLSDFISQSDTIELPSMFDESRTIH
jgi:hypothetical protein